MILDSCPCNAFKYIDTCGIVDCCGGWWHGTCSRAALMATGNLATASRNTYSNLVEVGTHLLIVTPTTRVSMVTTRVIYLLILRTKTLSMQS